MIFKTIETAETAEMTNIKEMIVEDILAKRLSNSAGLISREEFENLITEKYGEILSENDETITILTKNEIESLPFRREYELRLDKKNDLDNLDEIMTLDPLLPIIVPPEPEIVYVEVERIVEVPQVVEVPVYIEIPRVAGLFASDYPGIQKLTITNSYNRLQIDLKQHKSILVVYFQGGSDSVDFNFTGGTVRCYGKTFARIADEWSIMFFDVSAISGKVTTSNLSLNEIGCVLGLGQ